MSLIMSSELFKSSKNKSKILSTISNPINKELVKQLESYVKVSDLTEDDNSAGSKLDDSTESNSSYQETNTNDTSSEDTQKSEQTHTSNPASFVPNDSYDTSETDDREETSSEGSDEDNNTEEESSDDSDSNDVNESTSTNKTEIKSSTYVTADIVAKAVNELPGSLNLSDDTKGVDYAAFKTNANNANEVWIYYDSEVDVSKILSNVVTYLLSSGYYYLQFNRVSRDDNALVFVVNWVSNYFNVKSITDEKEK